jgi:hypothetical protein
VAIREADLDRLREWLPQLYAEAMHRLNAGESVFPSRQEENDYCAPEQQKRLLGHPWMDFIAMWLGKAENVMAKFISYPDIFEHALKIEPARIDHIGKAESVIRKSMEALGWYRDRDRVGGVMVRGFKPLTKIHEPEEDDDDVPI